MFFPAATVKNTCAVPPEESVRLVELRVSVGSCGAFGVMAVEMLTVPLKPMLVTVRVETAIDEFVEPLRIVRAFGFSVMWKSWEGTITVIVAV